MPRLRVNKQTAHWLRSIRTWRFWWYHCPIPGPQDPKGRARCPAKNVPSSFCCSNSVELQFVCNWGMLEGLEFLTRLHLQSSKPIGLEATGAGYGGIWIHNMWTMMVVIIIIIIIIIIRIVIMIMVTWSWLLSVLWSQWPIPICFGLKTVFFLWAEYG